MQYKPLAQILPELSEIFTAQLKFKTNGISYSLQLGCQTILVILHVCACPTLHAKLQCQHTPIFRVLCLTTMPQDTKSDHKRHKPSQIPDP